MSMIDHFTLSVTDLPRAVSFYEQALAPLGYQLVTAFEQYRGFGPKGKPTFWLKHAERGTAPLHIAFAATTRAAVDAFHAAAVAAGARDDGAPGLRAHYHPHYYGAFVIDPAGHPIEAVCHLPVAAGRARSSSTPKANARAVAKSSRARTALPAKKKATPGKKKR